MLEILQQDFDATHELLISKILQKVNPSVFKALVPANAFYWWKYRLYSKNGDYGGFHRRY